MTETAQSSQDTETTNLFGKAYSNLQDLGRSWACQSLTVGKSALENGAVSLQKGADRLGELATKLEAETTEATADPADASPAVEVTEPKADEPKADEPKAKAKAKAKA